jgi:hypothetical protein
LELSFEANLEPESFQNLLYATERHHVLCGIEPFSGPKCALVIAVVNFANDLAAGFPNPLGYCATREHTKVIRKSGRKESKNTFRGET